MVDALHLAKDYASLLLICRDEAIFALQTRTPAFDRFYKTLNDAVPIKNVTSHLAVDLGSFRDA